MRVHPDRQAGAAGGTNGPDSTNGTNGTNGSDRATEQMAALNAAWAVLGEPAERRRYDRELFGEDDAYDQPWAADLDGSAPMVAGLHSPRFRVSVAMILLVVLLVIFVFTAYAGTPTRS